MLKKLDATTTIPWEFVCYFDRERKTKPITQSKRIVFDVKKYSCFIRKYTTSALARCWENCTTPAYESFVWMLFGLLWNMIQNIMLYYTIHKSVQPSSRLPPHLLPFGQCIVEQTTLPLLNSLIVYCRVSSNFHFSLSIILFLVQKYWFIKKISRGGWSGFG